MKLVRYGKPGKEKPGMIDADGKLRDLSGVLAGIGPDQLSPKALAKLAKVKTAKLPLVRGNPRYGVPFTGATKFFSLSQTESGIDLAKLYLDVLVSDPRSFL